MDSNVQVINLVAANTIEEQMISKLQFKASMFAVALDNGDDEVLLEGGKLQEIIEQFDFEQESGTPTVQITPAAETENAAVRKEKEERHEDRVSDGTAGRENTTGSPSEKTGCGDRNDPKTVT